MQLQSGFLGGSPFKSSVLFLFLLVLGGCGQPKGQVTGKVTYKGELLRTGTVAFFGPGDQTDSAPIGSDGTYKASKVPMGDVKVTVSTPAPGPTVEQAKKNPMMRRKNFVPKTDEKTISIPKKYSDPSRSQLSLTVTQGSQPFDIDLK
jgi:hypothetical protein